jgi:hypothetical protein
MTQLELLRQRSAYAEHALSDARLILQSPDLTREEERQAILAHREAVEWLSGANDGLLTFVAPSPQDAHVLAYYEAWGVAVAGLCGEVSQ